MPGVEETSGAKPPLGAALAAGVEALSRRQTIHFVKYIKLVLPLDGYVFWVRADKIGTSALYNAGAFNARLYNQPFVPVDTGPTEFDAAGSLHYATDQYQVEDESFALNRVIFTSEGPIEDMNAISPTVVFIGQIDGIRFAFSQRGSFYKEADLYHYRGDAIYPSMESQIIDDPATMNRSLIVSNSLPLWLALNRFMPMYPSFLSPENIRPPYGVVHIDPMQTQTLQAAPRVLANGSRYQLAVDQVKITMWGLHNDEALDFVDYLNQYSLDSDAFGVMNMPTVRDEKRNQNELNILAQKKTVTYKVNYYQARVLELTRQLILSCIPTFIIAGYAPAQAVNLAARSNLNLTTDEGDIILAGVEN